MPIVAFTFSLRSVPRDHRELPHTRRHQVRVPHALLRAVWQDGALAGALSPRAPARHSELHVSDPRCRPRAGDKVDLARYNCVLDACVCAGDLARAKALTATMREKSVV